MAKPAIALYLGESYATIGLFDISSKKKPKLLFEKAIFLPQVSLKNLLNLTKLKIQEYFEVEPPFTELSLPVYVVTKYFNRLKQFRLGGSISQVVIKGFENSYTLSNSKALSLAASQLIISLDENEITESFLTQELLRIKKINPDLNKIVISVPEGRLSHTQITQLLDFFTNAGLKVFNCTSVENQNILRKTLLNAGSEGTKEEIISELKDAFGETSLTHFFCTNEFKSKFENCELFKSSDNFLACYLKSKNYNKGAYLDIDSLKFIDLTLNTQWESPWGTIPIEHYNCIDLSLHTYSEITLSHLSVLQVENNQHQLEPGPVLAGRAIKPLVIDLFYKELLTNELAKSIFTQLTQENLNQKIQNLFSVLEKAQKNPLLAISIENIKKNILETIQNEILFYSNSERTLVFGSLSEIVLPKQNQFFEKNYSWTQAIITMATKDSQ